MPKSESTTKIETARPALAEAVRDDLSSVSDMISEAVKKLERIGENAGGIDGLKSRCKGSIDSLSRVRDGLEEAGEHYYSALTATNKLAPSEASVESVDAELAEQVRQAKEREKKNGKEEKVEEDEEVTPVGGKG